MGFVSVSTAARAVGQVARPRLPSAAVVYLVLGVIAAIGLASFQDPLTASQWTPLFPLVGSLGILVGALRHQPVKIGAWLSIALGLFLFWIGNAASAGESMAGAEAVRPADLAYAAGYPLLLSGAFRLVRGSRGRDWTDYADGAIIGLAGAILLWIVLIDPVGRMHQLPDVAQAVILADVAIVAMLLPLPIVRETRSPSSIFLVVGFALLATADARYALLVYGNGQTVPMIVDTLGGISWLTGFVLLGAAALHPSSGTPRLADRASDEPS